MNFLKRPCLAFLYTGALSLIYYSWASSVLPFSYKVGFTSVALALLTTGYLLQRKWRITE